MKRKVTLKDKIGCKICGEFTEEEIEEFKKRGMEEVK